jgi:hypothetical protein
MLRRFSRRPLSGARSDLAVAKFGEHGRVALAGEDGVEHAQAADSVELGENVVQAHIHQVERPLPLANVRGGHLEVILAQAVEAAPLADGLGWDEAGTQQAVAVEHGVPLAVAHVALAPREVARVRAMEEGDLEARALEQVVDGNPVHAGGFHGHGLDVLLFEPLAERAQLAAEGAKGLDRGLRPWRPRAGWRPGRARQSRAEYDQS